MGFECPVLKAKLQKYVLQPYLWSHIRQPRNYAAPLTSLRSVWPHCNCLVDHERTTLLSFNALLAFFTIYVGKCVKRMWTSRDIISYQNRRLKLFKLRQNKRSGQIRMERFESATLLGCTFFYVLIFLSLFTFRYCNSLYCLPCFLPASLCCKIWILTQMHR
jgi:hypothetical protein